MPEVQAHWPDGHPILPLLWTDNFIELMPGETRILEATLPPDHRKPSITVTAWNADPIALPPR